MSEHSVRRYLNFLPCQKKKASRRSVVSLVRGCTFSGEHRSCSGNADSTATQESASATVRGRTKASMAMSDRVPAGKGTEGDMVAGQTNSCESGVLSIWYAGSERDEH